MDFMNMNQAAHGIREHGFIMTRLRIARKVVVGFWQESETQEKIGAWTRAAAAWHDWQGGKLVRFGDNMREVAVTERRQGRCATQVRFLGEHSRRGESGEGRECHHGQGSGHALQEHEATYEMSADLKKGGKRHKSIREAARISWA